MDCIDPPGLALQLAEIPPVSVHLQILDDQSTDQIQQLMKKITINKLEVTQSLKLKLRSQPNTPKNKNTTQKKGKPNPRKTRTNKIHPNLAIPTIVIQDQLLIYVKTLEMKLSRQHPKRSHTIPSLISLENPSTFPKTL